MLCTFWAHFVNCSSGITQLTLLTKQTIFWWWVVFDTPLRFKASNFVSHSASGICWGGSLQQAPNYRWRTHQASRNTKWSSATNTSILCFGRFSSGHWQHRFSTPRYNFGKKIAQDECTQFHTLTISPDSEYLHNFSNLFRFMDRLHLEFIIRPNSPRFFLRFCSRETRGNESHCSSFPVIGIINLHPQSYAAAEGFISVFANQPCESFFRLRLFFECTCLWSAAVNKRILHVWENWVCSKVESFNSI